jgi:hypothetical protein
MKIGSFSKTPGVCVLNNSPRTPFHHIPIEISGKKNHAWLLCSIDENKQRKRDCLVFTHPEELSGQIPHEIMSVWQSYNRELKTLKDEWRFRGVPTLKRVIRLHREKELFRHLNLATVIHHYGAVPALIVDQNEDAKLVLLNEAFGHDVSKTPYTDEEYSEVLTSFDDFLPLILHAYYQQIAFYLQSIFFGRSGDEAIGFCLRIRQIIGGSIRSKCGLIEKCPTSLSRSFELSKILRDKYEYYLKEAHAVDSFAHLLVNYIYRFFCIEERVDHYHELLQPSPTGAGRDLFSEDSISLIKRCTQNLLEPEDKFLDDLSKQKDSYDDWLYLMAEISTFIAEITNFTKDKSPDVPRIFLSHYFEVQDSERFSWLATQVTKDKYEDKGTLIKGRHLGYDLRWSLLARVWFSDYQILFLPSSWKKLNGTTKSLKGEEDWLLLELLYGQLIKKDIAFIISEPINETLIENFREYIRDYPESLKIAQVHEQCWNSFVHDAKLKLSEMLYTKKYIPCNLNDFDKFFDDSFKKDVLDKASRSFIRVLFRAWCYFFESAPWSIIQALILLGKVNDKSSTSSVRNLAMYILSVCDSDGRFQWARNYQDSLKLEDAIRDHIEELRNFAFKFNEGTFEPFETYIFSTKLHLQLNVKELYFKLCDKTHITPDESELKWLINQMLITRRS